MELVCAPQSFSIPGALTLWATLGYRLLSTVNTGWMQVLIKSIDCIEFYIFFLPALDSIGINVKV